MLVGSPSPKASQTAPDEHGKATLEPDETFSSMGLSGPNVQRLQSPTPPPPPPPVPRGPYSLWAMLNYQDKLSGSWIWRTYWNMLSHPVIVDLWLIFLLQNWVSREQGFACVCVYTQMKNMYVFCNLTRQYCWGQRTSISEKWTPIFRRKEGGGCRGRYETGEKDWNGSTIKRQEPLLWGPSSIKCPSSDPAEEVGPQELNPPQRAGTLRTQIP